MHAPDVGRAVAELILDGGYQTLDLSRMGYQRIIGTMAALPTYAAPLGLSRYDDAALMTELTGGASKGVL